MAQRFTRSQRQKLKQLILIGDMHRYTESEMMQFIKESLGYEISTRTLYEIKRENKQDAISWLSKMRGNKKYSYITEFKRQIEEFELYKAMLFRLYDSTKSELLKFKCIEKMSHMTIALVNMYNLLPQIAQNVPIELKNNNIDYDKDLSVYGFALVITITAGGWCYLLKKKHSNLILDFVCGESSIFEEILRSNKSDCTKLILAIGKGHLQSLVSKRLLGINPKFEKLIIALRTAYARDLILDKEQTSYPDILDALRLNLLNYPLRNSRAGGGQRKKITFDNYHLAFNDYGPIVFQQSFTGMN